MWVPGGVNLQNFKLISAANFRTGRLTMTPELEAGCMHPGVWVGSEIFKFAA